MKLFKQLIFISFISLLCIKSFAQEEQKYFSHTVQTGQSLYSIANMYGTNVAEILKLNPDCSEMIYSGQVLRIPQQKTTNTPTTLFHTIKQGETLYRLTVMYKVSAKDICDLNPGLNADNFHVGEVIRIPIIAKDTAKSSHTDTSNSEIQKNPIAPIRYKEMHKVKRRETVYSICKRYDLTEEELIAANPSIKTMGLQKGDLLYIPYPSPKKVEKPIPTNKELFDKIQYQVKQIGTIKMAIMLPFSKDNRMVEYYEGMLLAIDSLKRSGVSMDIYAYDTSSGISTLIKTKSELANMDIIFGPAEKAQIKLMADFARNHKIRLVIPFTSKDNEVFSNPYVYMVNTPQLYLYSTVYKHFHQQFKHPNVIFIDNTVGDKSKDIFIKGFKEDLLRNGITFTSISDEASIETMTDALFSERENVFIPTSGTHVALIKILTKMELLVRQNRSANICLFGYPEWQTLTKEHLKQFFAINTYFYSSFYTNDILPEARKFEQKYRNSYHKMMENRYPKYGMLGFDTGFYFLKSLSLYGSKFENNANKIHINPVQTGFLFERVNNWGGFINQKIFFVHYTPHYEIEKNNFD